MLLNNEGAEIYVPDGMAADHALARTTEMGIGAHPDDLEIMSYAGILNCYESPTDWYTGVIVTDGAGSPREGVYVGYTDDDMRAIRRSEQKKAAGIGKYGALVLMDHPSSVVKEGVGDDLLTDIQEVIRASSPNVVYTHNLADKHSTHVATALRVIQAIRELPPKARPKTVYGCEVWRDLDWLPDEDKVAFDVSGNDQLAASLLGAFGSQIAGGKRYDLAAIARRRANATFLASHATDTAADVIFAMDLTPLTADPELDIADYVQNYIWKFAENVLTNITELS